MAVFKKIRTLLQTPPFMPGGSQSAFAAHGRDSANAAYSVRPMTLAHLEEVWRLDHRVFLDGEAYSKDTFDYLLTTGDAACFRAVTLHGIMAGFIIGLLEPDRTGHITTIGVAPEHRRRGIARMLISRMEETFRGCGVRLIRLEVRSVNTNAQALYQTLGYSVTQRLPQYYSNGGDGLLMVKSVS